MQHKHKNVQCIVFFLDYYFCFFVLYFSSVAQMYGVGNAYL